MNKIMTAVEAVSRVKDGDTIMTGGFLQGGAPETLIDALYDQGTKNLKIIANDAYNPDCAMYKMFRDGRLSEYTAAHIGRNPLAGKMMIDGTLKMNLVPMGSLIEKIRCTAAGLGGFLTPTGVGTMVEEGKQVMEIDGKKYILELPIRADFGFVCAHTADEAGNLYFEGSTRNFNMMIAMAADFVIAEAEHIVPIGEINPNHVNVPRIFVDAIVQGRVL